MIAYLKKDVNIMHDEDTEARMLIADVMEGRSGRRDRPADPGGGWHPLEGGQALVTPNARSRFQRFEECDPKGVSDSRHKKEVERMKRLISRLLQGIIVLLGVTFLVFIASYLTGDPARLILGETASQEMIESYREFHGLNDPIIVQYGRFVMGILRGDFGTSLYYSQDCLSLIADKLVNTIQLASISLVLSLLLAIPLGILSADTQEYLGGHLHFIFQPVWAISAEFLAGADADAGLLRQ